MKEGTFFLIMPQSKFPSGLIDPDVCNLHTSLIKYSTFPSEQVGSLTCKKDLVYCCTYFYLVLIWRESHTGRIKAQGLANRD